MKKTSLLKLKKRQTKDWIKCSLYWKLFVECSRPSDNDLNLIGKIINKHIKSVSNPVIVILGSTPEFRDLCTSYTLQYDAKIICIELVKDMYMAMTDLLESPNSKERVIFNNWLEIELPDNSADIVLGDLTEGNIEKKFKQKYLAEIQRILKKGGKYITRQTSYINKEKANPIINQKDVEKLLDEYKQNVLDGRITLRQAGNYLGAKMVWESYYKTNGQKISLSAYSKEIDNMSKKIKNDPVKPEIIKIMRIVWGPIMDKFWDYYTLEKTLENFSKYYKDIKYYYSKDYPVAKYTPVFEMKK